MYSPYVLLPLISLLMTIFLVNRAWKYRRTPVFKTFIFLMLALAWWSLAAFLEITSPSINVKYFWVILNFLRKISRRLLW